MEKYKVKNIVSLSVYMALMVGVSVSTAAAEVKEGCFCIENTNKCLLIHGYDDTGAHEKGGYVDRKDCEKQK